MLTNRFFQLAFTFFKGALFLTFTRFLIAAPESGFHQSENSWKTRNSLPPHPVRSFPQPRHPEILAPHHNQFIEPPDEGSIPYEQLDKECMYFKGVPLGELTDKEKYNFIKFRERMRKEAGIPHNTKKYDFIFEKAIEEFKRSHSHTTCDQSPYFIRGGSYLEIKRKQYMVQTKGFDITKVEKLRNYSATGLNTTQQNLIARSHSTTTCLKQYRKWLSLYYSGGILHLSRKNPVIAEFHARLGVTNIDFSPESRFSQFITSNHTIISEWETIKRQGIKGGILEECKFAVTRFKTLSASNTIFSNLYSTPFTLRPELSDFSNIKDANVILNIEVLNKKMETLIHIPFTQAEIKAYRLEKTRMVNGNKMTLQGWCWEYLHPKHKQFAESHLTLRTYIQRHGDNKPHLWERIAFLMAETSSLTAQVFDPLEAPTGSEKVVYSVKSPNPEAKKKVREQAFETLYFTESTIGWVIVRPSIVDTLTPLDKISTFHVQYERPADGN